MSVRRGVELLVNKLPDKTRRSAQERSKSLIIPFEELLVCMEEDDAVFPALTGTLLTGVWNPELVWGFDADSALNQNIGV